MELSVIVPTFNEGPNVAELLRRLGEALKTRTFEVLFVDDSTDNTPDIIRMQADEASFPVRLIHRDTPTAGLSGAVVEGLRAAEASWCLVMDGDLQHPPEDIPRMLHRAARGDADVVVASRYIDGGDAQGLSDATRTLVSRGSTLLTKAMFPRRLHGCSDPMTGFFLVNKEAVDVTSLRPRGFKILLEVLARQQLRIAEVPFVFASRFAGESKATFTQGVRFLVQLGMLRFGRMSAFAIVGGAGAVANLAIMWALTHFGMNYVPAFVIASEVTIIANFLALEHLVFHDMREDSGKAWSRFAKSFLFNNVEAVVRLPVVWVLVNSAHLPSVIAAGLTLIVAFAVRFVYHALFVYAPKKAEDAATASAVVAPSTASTPTLDA